MGTTDLSLVLPSMLGWVGAKCHVNLLVPVCHAAYITWWFLTFFDNVFSPLYYHLLGYHLFGLGFMTSMLFILGVGELLGSLCNVMIVHGFPHSIALGASVPRCLGCFKKLLPKG